MAAARPLSRALLVAVALLGACTDDDDTVVDGAATTVAGSQPIGTGSETDAPGTATTATPAAGDETTGAPPTTNGDGEPPTAAPPATLDATGRVGSFAAALLRDDLSRRVVVELHVEGGAEPGFGAVEHVADVLADVSGKPVSVESASAPGGGARAWTAADLAAAADAGSVVSQGDGTAVVRLLFVHGTFEGDDGVLGVAVRGDVAGIFVDRVEAAGGLLGGSDGIETAVVTHEVGHLLGLVDLVLDTGRDDPEHPGHSTNAGSVMYWAVESDLVGQLLGADPPAEFDEDDRADLAAIGAGG